MRKFWCVFNVLVGPVWLQCRVSARPYVPYDGNAYATLDGASPTDSSNEGCQSSYMALPEGWQLAPTDATVVENVIAPYYWGTNLLTMANGAAYFTKNADRFGNVMPGDRWLAWGQLDTQRSSESLYRVAQCNYRILIYQELTTTVTATSTGTSTSITSTSVTETKTATGTSTSITSTSLTKTTTTTITSTTITSTHTSTGSTTTRTENPERSVSQSLIFMNVGLWTGGILAFYLVLLGAPVALFEYFRTPGLDRE